MAGVAASGWTMAAPMPRATATATNARVFAASGIGALLRIRLDQAVDRDADTLAAQAAHGDDQEDEKRRDRRQRYRQKLDRILDAPDRIFHVGAAVFDLSLLVVINVGARHLESAVFDLLQVVDHDLLGLVVKVGARSHFTHRA